ncbi:MAG: radical SAM protein [Euryarchaeota archaeon]|nr:radical SAM protein [Euryarchaeota archaeon]
MKLSEIFYSLQGEGVLIGTPTVFVRTAGCNLRCNWCDTEYARSDKGVEQSVQEVMDQVRRFKTRYVCVTGGEPLLQKDTYRLASALLDNNYNVSVETNGSISLEELPCSENMLISMDMKCPSSGMEVRMDTSNLELLSPADQLKFIVADEKDLLYALDVLQNHEILCPVIFTPVGGLDIRPVADWVLKRKLQVRVLPQLHKIIWGEGRGV